MTVPLAGSVLNAICQGRRLKIGGQPGLQDKTLSPKLKREKIKNKSNCLTEPTAGPLTSSATKITIEAIKYPCRAIIPVSVGIFFKKK